MNKNRISKLSLIPFRLYEFMRLNGKGKVTYLSYPLSYPPKRKQYNTDFSSPACIRMYNYRGMDEKRCKRQRRCTTVTISKWMQYSLPSRTKFYRGHLPYLRHIFPGRKQNIIVSVDKHNIKYYFWKKNYLCFNSQNSRMFILRKINLKLLTRTQHPIGEKMTTGTLK